MPCLANIVVTAMVAATPVSAAPQSARSVIILIADGGGYNTHLATSQYTAGESSRVFASDQWVRVGVATYSLRRQTKPVPGPEGLRQDPAVVYDSAKAWDPTPIAPEKDDPKRPARFSGYAWHRATFADSANTASAIVTGVRTYNNAVNVDGNGNPVPSLAEVFKKAGKSVGVVTTVELSDATPAAGAGAHQISRVNRADIARQIFNGSVVDVIIGGGNPDYENSGNVRYEPEYSWIGETDWDLLKEAKHPGGWTLIQSLADFQAAAVTTSPAKRLAGVFHSLNGHQFYRPGWEQKLDPPYTVARRTDVPTLMEMTNAALRVVERNDNGFFLLIEGGAVDRAMHANNTGRMIEEFIEFSQTIDAVSTYLDAGTHGHTWQNTLVLVTADHDHLLMGSGSDTTAYQPPVDQGKGNLPGTMFHSGSHSNNLVPLLARGPGAAGFAAQATSIDAFTDANGQQFGRGPYLQQPEIHDVILRASGITAEETKSVQ
jgi:alkaline phosphatase